MSTDHASELDVSSAQIAAASRIATALVVGFSFCEDEGYALTELQRIQLVRAALVVFDDFRAEMDSHARLGAALRSMSQNGHGDATGGLPPNGSRAA